jgi:quinol monooxygenase YgiN
MDAPVAWVLEVAIKPGRGDAFRALVDEMVRATRGEPGALVYEWAGDGDAVAVYERYADSAAALAHVAAWGSAFAGRFLEAAEPTRLTVMGNPTDELKAALDGFGPTFLGPLGGFAR